MYLHGMKFKQCKRCAGSGELATGKSLRKYREKHNVRMGRISKYLGVSKAYLYALECGTSPVSAYVTFGYIKVAKDG